MNNQQKHVLQAVRETKSSSALKEEFEKRISRGNLSRDENEFNHFCIMFLAYDPSEKKYFIGDHKKSGLWLFSGGHTDEGETPHQTLVREIVEEWGMKISVDGIKAHYLTISKIENQKHNCKLHYDIWYVFERLHNEFNFDEEKVLTEFSEYGWKTAGEIRALNTHETTLKIEEEIEKIGEKM